MQADADVATVTRNGLVKVPMTNGETGAFVQKRFVLPCVEIWSRNTHYCATLSFCLNKSPGVGIVRLALTPILVLGKLSPLKQWANYMRLCTFLHLITLLTEYLGQQLEDYVATLPVSVKVLRTEKRSGLIRARLLGAKHVKGQVITFLDAHCECTEGWLEPLLGRIAVDRLVHLRCWIINFVMFLANEEEMC